MSLRCSPSQIPFHVELYESITKLSSISVLKAQSVNYFFNYMYVQSFAVNKCFNIESFLIIFLSLRDCLIPCTTFECMLGSITTLFVNFFHFFKVTSVTFCFFCSHNSHNHIHDMLISLQNIKELLLKPFTDIQCQFQATFSRYNLGN